MAWYNQIFEKLETRLSLADWAWRAAGTVVSFGLPAWAAHATDWLIVYGPIAWVIAGCVGLVFSLTMLFLAHIIRHKIIKDNILRKYFEKTDKINPMDQHFKNQRIMMSDLIPPYINIIEGKTFIECEIIGPADIAFSATRPGGVSISSNNFLDVAGVIVKNESSIPTVILFTNCVFLRCKLARLLLFVPEVEYEHMASGLPGITWLTPGYPKIRPSEQQA